MGRLLLLMGMLLAAGRAARAATPYTETFDSSLSGWTNSGDHAWVATGGLIQVVFPVLVVPPAKTARLWSSPIASAGAFTGDYASAGIQLFGFSLEAVNLIPSELVVSWNSGSNFFSRNVKPLIIATGVWHHIALPLTGRAEGQWTPEGDEEPFLDSLTNVESVSVRLIGQSLMFQTRYRMDNIFVDRLHAGSRMQATTNGYGDITWSYVRSNFTYQLQYADAQISGWSTAEVVTATSTSLISSVALSNQASRVYRLLMP